jgi:hypothetical protein
MLKGINGRVGVVGVEGDLPARPVRTEILIPIGIVSFRAPRDGLHDINEILHLDLPAAGLD